MRQEIGSPPTEKSIEDESNQDRSGKIRLNEGDILFRHEDDITKLLSRHTFSIGEEKHYGDDEMLSESETDPVSSAHFLE